MTTDGYLLLGHGDVAYTTEGNYEVDEDGVATITLNLNQHPQGRMTFTGVGKGKELVVEGLEYLSQLNTSTLYMTYKEGPITFIGEDDGTVTLYGRPTSDIVSGTDITLKVKYDGKLYTKTFANKAFKENSNITLATPSLEGGWTEATVPVTGVTLNKNRLVLYTGTDQTLTATVAPAKTATCRVTVITSVTGVTLNKTATTIAVGASETLTATVVPGDAYNKNVTWTSSDPAVATVDASGKVTGVAKGTATITVTTENGGHTATCAVEVADIKSGNHDPYTIETLTW